MNKAKLVFITIIIGLATALLLLAVVRYSQPQKGVLLKETRTGEFQLFVDGHPYFVQGAVYQPVPVGQHHAYNFWGAEGKPWLKDGRLMNEMGVNTVRFFQPGDDPEQTKELIGDLYHKYGIRSILGHWIDYWQPGNYADKEYRDELTNRVLEMVRTYKDEEGLLLWILGNENNLSWHSSGRVNWSCPEVEEITDPKKKELAKARIYYSLINHIALKIKEIDPLHPVALGNADTYSLEIAKEAAPAVDLVALTCYRGKTLGNLWRQVKERIDKPVLIMEFGCDGFNAKNQTEAQPQQSAFLTSQWLDIESNRAGLNGEGISLGGCIFEWTDEWWKHDETSPASWYVHDTAGDWSCGGYYFDIGAENNLNINEEWWGIIGLDPELQDGINRRLPKKAYYDLKKLWK